MRRPTKDKKSLHFTKLNTPLGDMIAAEYNGKLCLLEFLGKRKPENLLKPISRYYGVEISGAGSETLRQVKRQLRHYFDRKLKSFRLSLDFAGTDFQKKVWRQLLKVPYGKTSSYGAIAEKIDSPGASRAVGMANGANPIAIVVPCHRVIGKSGKLVGYGGGLWRKKWLLKHEGSL